MIIKLVPKQEKDALYLYDDLRKVQLPKTEKLPYYIEPQVPNLPKWTDRIYHAQDHEINLYKLICSCEKFQQKKELYLERDIRLCCRHIYFKLINTKAREFINSLNQNLIFLAAIFEMDCFHSINIDKQTIYYALHEKSNWIQVLVPLHGNDENSYSRFSYNTDLRRWSYSIAPENEGKLSYMARRIKSYYNF